MRALILLDNSGDAYCTYRPYYYSILYQHLLSPPLEYIMLHDQNETLIHT